VRRVRALLRVARLESNAAASSAEVQLARLVRP
jgi:hypothetical protein